MVVGGREGKAEVWREEGDRKTEKTPSQSIWALVIHPLHTVNI